MRKPKTKHKTEQKRTWKRQQSLRKGPLIRSYFIYIVDSVDRRKDESVQKQVENKINKIFVFCALSLFHHRLLFN